MRHVLRICLTTAMVGAAVTALIAAVIPIWLVFRVPPALVPPGASAAPRAALNRSRTNG